MTAVEIFQCVRRRWLTVILLLVLGVAGGAAVTRASVPQFAASTELFVSVQSTDSSTAGDIGQANSAAQQKVKSYTQVATSSRVLQPVIDELHLGISPVALAKRVTATAQPNSVIIAITVRDIRSDRAAKIANAVGMSLGTVVVDRLEKPVGGGSGLVRIETVQPATAQSSPVSPNAAANLAAGLLLGLAAGVGLALLRTALDTRVRSAVDAERVTGHSVIGSIGFDPTATTRPLIVQLDPRSPRAESFRSLRTNLQFIDAGKRARRFLLTSAMQGEGKTTTVANLAIAMAESGARVLVIDADLRRPRLAEVLGLEGAVGLTDVLVGRAEMNDVIQPWGDGALSVMPAGQIPPNPSELLGSRAMQLLLDVTDDRYDYVILDTPPLLPVTDAAVLSKMTDGSIVVTAAGRSRRAQLNRAAAALDHLESRVLGIVIAMVPLRGPNRDAALAYGSYYGPSSPPRAGRLRALLPSSRGR